MEFVTESGVVSVVVTCQGVVGPYKICYREWSGIRCRDLPENGGATWSLLRRVEWGSVHCRDLLESLGLTAEARLGRLMERNGFLSQQSKRSSDVFEVVGGLTIVGCLRH